MTVRVQQLEGSRGLRRFVAAPWRILDVAEHPQWIPPLRMSTHGILHPRKNPFFKNAERALFLAERGGREVGRVAAIHNGWARDAGKDPGFVGFFESADDPEVAGALLQAAEGWLAERGCRSVTGPLNPSTNYEGGVLVEGFEHPQVFLTPWNPPYYASLFEAAGYEKAADLYGWHLTAEQYGPRFDRAARRAERRHDPAIRSLSELDFEYAMTECWRIYTACWEQQWGFVPLARDEWLFIAGEMKPLMIPESSLGVEIDGEIVGFVLVLPDYGRAMAPDRSGRLLPLNWWRLLRARKSFTWARVMLAGILPEHRRSGFLQLMLREAVRRTRHLGLEHTESSWILENNTHLNPFFERMGGERYRVWRVFRKALAG